MNIEEAVKELREEPVPERGIEQVLAAIERPKSRKRFILLTPLAATAILIGLVLFPWHRSDDVWAQAVKALKDAKAVHLVFAKKLETVEAWVKGEKTRRLMDVQETRNNGSQYAIRNGNMWSVEQEEPGTRTTDGLELFDVGLFQDAQMKLSDSGGSGAGFAPYHFDGSPKKLTFNGKVLVMYQITGGTRYFGDGDMKTPIAESRLKVFVDPDAERIVRMEQDPIPVDPKKSLPNWFDGDAFQATIDYPDDLPDSMFRRACGRPCLRLQEERQGSE